MSKSSVATRSDDGELRLYTSRRIDVSLHPLPTMTRGADGTPTITFPINSDRAKLLAPLQFLEAFGHFLFGIQQVDWLGATEEWIPENDADRARFA